jgi:hypothetical protein
LDIFVRAHEAFVNAGFAGELRKVFVGIHTIDGKNSGTVIGTNMNADALEVSLEAGTILIWKIIIDKEGREGGVVERRVGEGADRERQIVGESFGARSHVKSMAVLLPIVHIRYLLGILSLETRMR